MTWDKDHICQKILTYVEINPTFENKQEWEIDRLRRLPDQEYVSIYQIKAIFLEVLLANNCDPQFHSWQSYAQEFSRELKYYFPYAEKYRKAISQAAPIYVWYGIRLKFEHKSRFKSFDDSTPQVKQTSKKKSDKIYTGSAIRKRVEQFH